MGQTLKLKIIEMDEQKRAYWPAAAPWCARKRCEEAEAWARLKEGEVVHGIVRRLTDFGAFVDLGGVDGHVTDLSWALILPRLFLPIRKWMSRFTAWTRSASLA